MSLRVRGYAEPAPTTHAEHTAAVAAAEARLGRTLTLAERSIDIVQIDRQLRTAKAKLAELIAAEQRRAARRHFRTGRPIRLELTPEMRAVLAQLYRAGVKAAETEIRRLTGATPAPARSMAGRTRGDVESRLQHLLNAQAVRVNQRLARAGSVIPHAAAHVAPEADAGLLGQQAVVREVAKIPGALDVASRIVSSGMFAGIGDVYDANNGLFSTWEYSAVNDAGTCGECESHDGETFDSWEAIQDVLPDGGPNPACDGEDRCRCRAVPGAEADQPTEEPGAPLLPVDEAASPIPDDTPPFLFPGDVELLPAHARQDVATLTVAEAKAQRDRLIKYLRPLRQHHAKGTRPVNPAKIGALERRIAQLDHHIAGRPVEVPPVVRPVAPPTPPPVAPTPPPPPRPVVVPPTPPAPPAVAIPASIQNLADSTLPQAVKRAERDIAELHRRLEAYGGTSEALRESYLRQIARMEQRHEHLLAEIQRRKDLGIWRKAAPRPRAKPQTAAREGTARSYFRPYRATTEQKRKVVDSAETAMRLLDQVFVKYDENAPKIKLMTGNIGRGTYGHYRRASSRLASDQEIALNTSIAKVRDDPAQAAETFWHEWGHFMDWWHHDTNVGAFYLSESTRDPHVVAVMNTIRSSRSGSRVIADAKLHRSQYTSYLASDRELWARAFAQYVGTKLSSETALSEADRALVESVHTKNVAESYSGRQWEARDFAPVREAFDRLFAARGWLRGG